MSRLIAVLLLALAAHAADWHVEAEKAKQSYAAQHYPEALTGFASAESAAREAGDDSAVLECQRLEAAVQRDSGDVPGAIRLLQTAAIQFVTAHGQTSLDLAPAWEDMATFYRSQGQLVEALASLDQAIAIRDAHSEVARDPLARDLTAAGVMRQHAGQRDTARDLLKRAIQVWDASNPADPQSLPAIEALAGMDREEALYADAEPLLLRALRLREAAVGPDDADMITPVDSLAYVEFGLRKLPEAEAYYKRLLALWEKNASPEHPMVALTLDKMAELYVFEKRYADADACTARALDLRTRMELASLDRSGRLLLLEKKLPEAEDLYRRAIQIGELAHAPDEALDPPLRAYANILHQRGKEAEAKAVEKRIKQSVLRRATAPQQSPHPTAQGSSSAPR